MTLRWHRDEWGVYADNFNEAIRYYVRNDRRDSPGAPWIVEAVKTVEVAGLIVVKPGTNPVWVDRFHPTQRVAKAVAAAYDTEPVRVDGKATNRLTRAIERAYREDDR